MRRALLALLLCAFHATHSQAVPQSIVGRVLERAVTTPVAGAVVLLVDARDSTLARTLTDGAGRFRMSPVANAAALRVMRIGFTPATRPWGLTTNAEPASIEILLDRLPAVLPALTVVEQTNCPADRDAATTFAVLEQARAALAATQLAQESNPAVVHLVAYDRVFGPDRRELRSQTVADTSFRSTRGMVSQRSAAEYATFGYRDVDTVRQVERYYAPDVQVLLDPDFAATHCFAFAGASNAYPEDIGVTFTPRRVAAGKVDVSGTIWVRRVSPALHVIDFRFTNAESVRGVSDSLAGGATTYREMPNGLTLPIRWNVHAPIRVQQRLRVGNRMVTAATTTVAGIRETGGAIAAARWDDGISWDAGLPQAAGRIVGDGDRPVDSALISIRGSALSVRSDADGNFTLPPLIEGRYALDIVDAALSDFGVVRNATQQLTVESAPSAPLHVAMPSLRPFVDSLCAGEDGSLGAVLIGAIRSSNGSPASGAILRGVWSGADTLRDGVMILQGETDASGRFHVCGAPTGVPIRLSATNGESVALDTAVIIAPGNPVATILITMTALTDPRLPSFRRRALVVEDPIAKVPVADVEVSQAIDERVLGRTSADGRLRLGALPEGTALLRLRKPGFAQRVVMVQIRGNDTAAVHVAFSRVARLDAVQVNASVSSARATASGFETRMLRGTGRFLGSAELRRFDGEALLSATRRLGIRDRDRNGTAVLLGGRGGKPCPMTIIVDGSLFYSNTWRGVDPPDARALLASEYAAIEYYADDDLAPPEYSATGAGCGTLLLWTRD